MGGASGINWRPEHTVSPAEAGELIGAQFPRLRGAPVAALATGWDNTVFLVDDEWVFRFPRRSVALSGFRREMTMLSVIAPRLPLPIPVPEFAGEPTTAFPWPFWGARHLRGRELADARLPDAARTAAAAGLGAFLRALHALTPAAGLQTDPMQRAEPAVRGPMAREWLSRLADTGHWVPGTEVEQVLSEGERLGPPTGPVVLSHGDLHIRHLLVDDAGEAAGVIDWGDLCVADPSVDLSLAYAGFAGPARAALLSAYGPVSAECELRARVLAMFLCAVLAGYAVDTGRESLRDESLAGVARAAR